jgi:hypothetical protein
LDVARIGPDREARVGFQARKPTSPQAGNPGGWRLRQRIRATIQATLRTAARRRAETDQKE